MLVAAVEQDSGVVLGQVEVESQTNEIPAARELAAQLDLQGRTVTLAALHEQQETAHLLREDCGAHYVMTAVKGNQPTIVEDLQALDFSSCPVCQTSEKRHGRNERRTYWVLDLSGSQWDGNADLFGRRQAVRVVRERETIKPGEQSVEVTWALTSLPAAEATVEQLAALIRNHWHIENRLHYVRDFTYDEDRCRVYVRDLPRHLACLTNPAISIIRCHTPFRYVPPAARHFAARQQEALDLLLRPPRR